MEQPGSVLPAYYLTRSLFTSCWGTSTQKISYWNLKIIGW
jgi:hypothetical protein